MDKRYQVFISSTFTDLKHERQAVLRAVLELDHMPAGMELFPAADDTAWQLIKDVIDNSDYYVLIIGGRYGSLDETGIGYTEKEYDYAVDSNKPVISLLHENPDNLPREKTETDETIWDKLKQFCSKVESRHTCVYWNSPDDLKAKVIIGLTAATKRHPRVGWIRADKLPSKDTLKELLDLRKQNAELEAQLKVERTGPPKGSEEFVQGEDEFTISCEFTARFPDSKEYYGYADKSYSGTFPVNWNDMWGGIAPTLLNEATESQLRNAFWTFFTSRGKEAFNNDKDLKGASLKSFSFSNRDIETCIVQFRALGLMKESDRQRSIKDTNTYWTMTTYGDQLMVQLRAIRKEVKLRKPTPGQVVPEDEKYKTT